VPLHRDQLGAALTRALSVSDEKLGFLCHTGKFELWLRDECAFALHAAHGGHHVAREHERMDIAIIDPDIAGITIWQLKQSYSINQWMVEGSSFAWPPRGAEDDGRHGDYRHRIGDDLNKARDAAVRVRKKTMSPKLAAHVYVSYVFIHPSRIADSSTVARLTQKYADSHFVPWQKKYGGSVGGFSGLRTSATLAVESWTIDGQAVSLSTLREPLPGPAGLNYSLFAFTWGPFSC
jgi:hypothetical protein